MIRFSVIQNRPINEGQVIYRTPEYSFDFKPTSPRNLASIVGERGVASILLGSLQLEIGVTTGAVLYAWGYHPHTMWRPARLAAPPSRAAGIEASFDRLVVPGAAIELSAAGIWPTYFDRRTGWVCIGTLKAYQSRTSECIEFATNTLAVLESDQLRAIWLQPVMEEAAPPGTAQERHYIYPRSDS